MGKVVCLKMVSGEELIGQDNGSELYSDLAAIMMVPGNHNNGQVGLGLMPFLPYAEDSELHIPDTHIMIKFSPSDDMLNNYNRIYGSGIQIASGRL